MAAFPATPVLIVDDDAQLRQLWAEFLEQRGYVVSTCRSLEDLRALLASGSRFTLAMVDWSLPDGNGADVLEAVEGAGAGTSVGLTTGNEARISAAARARAAAVLLKPFRLKQLDEVLTRLTSG